MRSPSARKPRTLIVTPTYNERGNLERHVLEVRAAAPDAHLLIVDDASPDGTGVLADSLAARDDHVHVLHRPGKLGLGTAYLEAFERALGEEYERILTMDADLSHDARFLPDFERELDRGADVVVGSRNMARGRVVGWGVGRHLLSKGGSWYARAILGLDVRDLTSGYKAFTRRSLEAIDLTAVRSTGYAFMIEMTYRAVAGGMNVTEVPIVFVDRVFGHSKMSRKILLEAVVVVLRLRFDGRATRKRARS
jgi:dolichol-phosphate mannosyltransferase